MSTRIVFFASIREALGTGETELELPAATRATGVIALLREQFGEAAAVLEAENTRIAVDQEMISGDPVVDGATEIAFFPPVTGG